jgi:hypothetical protein
LYDQQCQRLERQAEDDLRQQVEREKPLLFENFIRDLLSGTVVDSQLLENTGVYLQEFIGAQDRFCVVAVRPVNSSVQAERHSMRCIKSVRCEVHSSAPRPSDNYWSHYSDLFR